MPSWNIVRKTRNQPFNRGDAIAGRELLVDPLLDLHRPKLIERHPPEPSEGVPFKRVFVPQICTRIDGRPLDSKPVAPELRNRSLWWLPKSSRKLLA